MMNCIGMVYGFDFSDKSNYPINENKVAIERIIKTIYENIDDFSDDINDDLISVPYSGYGDDNYYIGFMIANTEDMTAKEALKLYDNVLKTSKSDLDDKILEKLDTIISELKNYDNEDSLAYGVSKEYAEYGIEYFELIKNKQEYHEIEFTD